MAIDKKAMFKMTCGLFALFTNDGAKDNACIVNTVLQVTSEPLRFIVCVNKSNYSCEIIRKTGIMNVSSLDESSKFELYQRFGFFSGREVDKLAAFDGVATSENGLKYLTEQSNAFLSLKVESETEFETHILFTCTVTEAQVLANTQSATYAYYHASIKPKVASGAASPEKKIVGWVCKICNYVYEGAELPADFTCPLCKHPASDFEPIYG